MTVNSIATNHLSILDKGGGRQVYLERGSMEATGLPALIHGGNKGKCPLRLDFCRWQMHLPISLRHFPEDDETHVYKTRTCKYESDNDIYNSSNLEVRRAKSHINKNS